MKSNWRGREGVVGRESSARGRRRCCPRPPLALEQEIRVADVSETEASTVSSHGWGSRPGDGSYKECIAQVSRGRFNLPGKPLTTGAEVARRPAHLGQPLGADRPATRAMRDLPAQLAAEANLRASTGRAGFLPLGVVEAMQGARSGRVDALVPVVPADPIAGRGAVAEPLLDRSRVGGRARSTPTLPRRDHQSRDPFLSSRSALESRVHRTLTGSRIHALTCRWFSACGLCIHPCGR